MLKRFSIGLTLFLVVAIAFAVGFESNCPMSIKHPKDQKARSHLSFLGSAIKTYQLENGRYPTTGQGLEALVSKPTDELENWQQYLVKIPKDPWGSNFIYENEKMHGQEFLIYSKGPDGVNSSGALDDVVNWDKEYECQYYQTCPTVCEYARNIAFLVAFFTFILLLVCFLYFLVRLVVPRKNA